MNVIEPPCDEVMDYRGLAGYLKVSPGTLRHWVMRERIPFIKVGSNVRFARKQIEAWLESNARKPRMGRSRGGTEGENGDLFGNGGGEA
jgi:excisionase family DNA binding protein